MEVMARLHGLGFVSALGYGVLSWLNQPGHPLPLSAYFLILGLCWGALGLAVTVLAQGRLAQAIVPILLWALIFRAIGLAANPILEDDFYRYLWDGRQLVLHGNPYDSSPQDHFDDSELEPKFEAILSRVNYPHLPTIYAPVLQYLFGTAYILSPGELWPWKGLLLVADLLAGLLVFRLGGLQALLLYSWCPLLIQETAFTAHPDVLGALFVIAAYDSRKSGAPVRTGILLGLAVGTKITGAIIAPFLLKGQPRRAWFAAAAAWIVAYLPFWAQGSWADWKGLAVFAKEWEFNSGGFALLSLCFGHAQAPLLAAIAILIPLACFWWRTSPLAVSKSLRGDWVFGWFFTWSTVVQPWYLVWLLPWVALIPSWAGITALASVSLSYITWMNLGADHPDPFGHPGWVRPVEYGLVLIALGVGIGLKKWNKGGIRARTRKAQPEPTGAPPAGDET
jgi:alpha-1,6-mannosyltransferase